MLNSQETNDLLSQVHSFRENDIGQVISNITILLFVAHDIAIFAFQFAELLDKASERFIQCSMRK